jgi:hypothetical protein
MGAGAAPSASPPHSANPPADGPADAAPDADDGPQATETNENFAAENDDREFVAELQHLTRVLSGGSLLKPASNGDRPPAPGAEPDPFTERENALLERLEGLNHMQRTLVLTGRSGTVDGAALRRDLGKLMHDRLLALEAASRADAENAAGGWKSKERVGQDIETRPGFRDFNAQAGLFYKALTLKASEVRARAVVSWNLPDGRQLIRQWKDIDLQKRMEFVMQYSSLPGTSRHHWGTDVDVVEASSKGWKTKARLLKLAGWLSENGPRLGFTTAYNADHAGRGGYQHEPWHLSNTRIASRMLGMYRETMYSGPEGATGMDQLISAIAVKLMALHALHDARAKPPHFTQATLLAALKQIDIKQYIEGVDGAVKG